MKAFETLKQFEKAIEKDGGAAYRQALAEELPKLDDAYRGEEDALRSHLGISMIGEECERKLFLLFRWFGRETFDGRMLRLFNRGHLEEGRFLALMRAAGMTVSAQTDAGRQHRLSWFGGHVGSALDGFVWGVPESPQEWMVAEFKTHNTKSFSGLLVHGVKEAKNKHYIQTQCYAAEYGLQKSLYVAVNKNDDELYAEVLETDTRVHQWAQSRAHRVIFALAPPKRISNNSAYFACKFCNFSTLCHKKATAPKNCRTCQHSRPVDDGLWACGQHGHVLSKDDQLKGCDDWQPIDLQ